MICVVLKCSVFTGDIMGCGILFPPDYDSEADSDLSPDDPDVCNDVLAEYEDSDSEDEDIYDDGAERRVNGGQPAEDGTLVCVSRIGHSDSIISSISGG